MNMSLRNIGLSLGVIALTSVSFAQKKNETSAAVEYKNKYMTAMAKGDMENAKKALISAKDFIDLAAVHVDTKDSQKTNWLKGEIYASFLTLGMQSQDTNFMKMAGEDAMDQSIAAFKHGYGLGKKMQADYQTSVYQKASMLNGMAGMLYKADQFKEAAEVYEYQAKYSDAINELDSSAIYNASLCHEKSGDFEKTDGMLTFWSVISLLQLNRVYSINQVEKPVRMFPYNTHTFLADFYLDFGTVGLVIFSIFLGMIVYSVYLRSVRSNDCIKDAEYLYFGFATFMMFFSNHFSSVGYPLRIFIVFELYRYFAFSTRKSIIRNPMDRVKISKNQENG